MQLHNEEDGKVGGIPRLEALLMAICEGKSHVVIRGPEKTIKEGRKWPRNRNRKSEGGKA